MDNQTVHIPIKSLRVLAFLRAKYAPVGFYKLSHKQSLGVFIGSLLVTKNKCPQFIKYDTTKCFSVALGSYKHMDRKCFILPGAIDDFNNYVEHKMKEYFFEWMSFYRRFSGTDTKACIEKFIADHNMPDSETDVEYFRTTYKRYNKKNAA